MLSLGCFDLFSNTRFLLRDALVPVNAMYKLRQRNAHVVRSAEMDKGREEMYFDTKLPAESVRELSPYLADLCAGTNVIHTRQKDLQVNDEHAMTDNYGHDLLKQVKAA